MVRAWTPYILVGLLLVATRLKSLPLLDWFKPGRFQSQTSLGLKFRQAFSRYICQERFLSSYR